MPILFEGVIGSVIQLEESGEQCTTQLLGLPDSDITFAEQRSIVTRMTLSQQVNLQFLHTLGAMVYIYVFGDRIGQVTLSGLSFACPCPDDGDLGAELMLAWYHRYKASRRRLPVRIMIGRETIEGFVTGVTEDVVDPSTSLVQWGLNLSVLPDDFSDLVVVNPVVDPQPLPPPLPWPSPPGSDPFNFIFPIVPGIPAIPRPGDVF